MFRSASASRHSSQVARPSGTQRAESEMSQDPERLLPSQPPSPPPPEANAPPPLHRNHLQETASQVSEDPEQYRPPRPPSPPPPEANAPPPAEEVTSSRLLAHYSTLVVGGMIGTAVRLALISMGTYDGAVIYALAWPQGVGCAIMGLALARRNELITIYPPVYTFLTTGLAGSVTTFSTWIIEGYVAFANVEGSTRNAFDDSVAGTSYSFSTFAIGIACIAVGNHFATPVHRVYSTASALTLRAAFTKPEFTESHKHVHKPKTLLLDGLTIASGFVAYAIVLFVFFYASPPLSKNALLAILLGPPGAMIRFFLSRINTKAPFIDRFPLGTFICNLSATVLAAGIYAAQNGPLASQPIQDPTLAALYGLSEGFCGCLSTLSTFSVEARAIKALRWKWLYVVGSVVLGHLLVWAIIAGAHNDARSVT